MGRRKKCNTINNSIPSKDKIDTCKEKEKKNENKEEKKEEKKKI